VVAVATAKKDPRKDGGIRIAELVRRSGVSRATIQHYLNEGLLPRPRKTGRTMAYYDAASVERVLLIKELQQRHLPLGVIRGLLDPKPAEAKSAKVDPMRALAARGEELEKLLAPTERPLLRSEVTRATGVAEESLDELERHGMVTAQRRGGQVRYGACDVAVLRAIGRLNAGGLNAELGFHSADLVVYREAMKALLAREVELFSRSVRPRSNDDFVRLAHAAAVGASELVAALHRKLVTELVANSAESPSKPQGVVRAKSRRQRRSK
jgi:DNA-binding transcriptional MerR regulator